jgi:integrase/recombinase XerD
MLQKYVVQQAIKVSCIMMVENLITKFYAYLTTQQCAAHNTVVAYCRDIQQFVFFFKERYVGKDIYAIERDHALEFIADLSRRCLQPSTIARKIISLKMFYSYIAERYHIPNIMSNVRAPKQEKRLPHYLSLEDIERLMRYICNNKQSIGERNYLLVYLLYAAGLRVSELTSLTRDSFCAETSLLLVQGKGSKQRYVPVPDNVAETLRHYCVKNAAVSWLFFGKRKGKVHVLSRQSCWAIVRKICFSAGIDRPVWPHQLRHSLATHMLQSGADLRSLQLLLGHQTIKTVQIYTHVNEDHLRKLYKKAHLRS